MKLPWISRAEHERKMADAAQFSERRLANFKSEIAAETRKVIQEAEIRVLREAKYAADSMPSKFHGIGYDVQTDTLSVRSVLCAVLDHLGLVVHTSGVQLVKKPKA